jgi:hypothetical protein
MSQWGKERLFIIADGSIMHVIAHVAGPVWVPLHPDHKIDDLISDKSTDAAAEKLAELKKQWIGKTHREWALE